MHNSMKTNILYFPIKLTIILLFAIYSSYGQSNFDSLVLAKTKTIRVGPGVKSVIFDPSYKHIYALNLEGMSVYEISRDSQEISRKIVFDKTPAKGFNYTKKEWFDSYAEKPVEGYFSHQGRFLWVSLHNADGLVVWDVKNKENGNFDNAKKAKLYEGKTYIGKISLPFFETGKTPKVISGSPKNNHLYVSNWHSNSVSVLDISGDNPNNWEKKQDLKGIAIPRGLAVNYEETQLYIAEMGGFRIFKYNTSNFSDRETITVGAGPRHLITDQKFLYASLNRGREIVKVNIGQWKVAERNKTLTTPRTICLSPDKSVVVVTCYKDDKVQVFRASDLKLLATWDSPGRPVGVDIVQDGETIEAWVCNYNYGTIKVFTFKKV